MKKLINLVPIVLLLIASNFPYVNTQSSHDTGASAEAVIRISSSLNEMITPVSDQSLAAKLTSDIQPAVIDIQIEREQLIPGDVAGLWEAEAEADIETENWMSNPDEWLAKN